MPSGSARIVYHGSVAIDGWHLRTSKERDAAAIQNSKSYYNTQKHDPMLVLQRRLVLDNPKRAMAEAMKREAVELDNRLYNERLSSKAYTSEYSEWRTPQLMTFLVDEAKNKTPRQYGKSPIFARGMPIFSTNLSAMAEFGTATTSHPP